MAFKTNHSMWRPASLLPGNVSALGFSVLCLSLGGNAGEPVSTGVEDMAYRAELGPGRAPPPSVGLT